MMRAPARDRPLNVYTAPPTQPRVEKDARGVRRLVGRRRGEVRGTVVVCPDGHRAGRAMRHGTNAFPLECCHSDTKMGGQAAVHWLYVLPDGDESLVVECHLDEAIEIRRGQMSLEQIRAYLGVMGDPTA